MFSNPISKIMMNKNLNLAFFKFLDESYPIGSLRRSRTRSQTFRPELSSAEISRDYKAFRDFIKRPCAGKVDEFKRPAQAKSNVEEINDERDYEPTNAIYCNNSDWRRWVRVKEWFNEYSSDAKTFERFFIDQIKMDT